MTYSAWQCLAPTDPTVRLGLLEVTERMCGAGGKRACVPSASMFQDVFTRLVPVEAAARLSPPPYCFAPPADTRLLYTDPELVGG